MQLATSLAHWRLRHRWGRGGGGRREPPNPGGSPPAARQQRPARRRRAGRASAGAARSPGRDSPAAARHTARDGDGQAGLCGLLVGHGGAEPAVSAPGPPPGARSVPQPHPRAPNPGQGWAGCIRRPAVVQGLGLRRPPKLWEPFGLPYLASLCLWSLSFQELGILWGLLK